MNKRDEIWYVFPALLLSILMTVVPIAVTAGFSLVRWDITTPGSPVTFIAIKNYIQLIHDGRFGNAVKVMLILISFPVAFQMLFGLLLAIALNERLVGTKWMRWFFLSPAIMPPVVIGLVWKLFLIPGAGGLAYLLYPFGDRNVDVLGTPVSALIVIIIAAIWAGTPFVSLMYLASIESISTNYYEAAEIDGASWVQRHRIITLPLIAPMTKTLAIFRILEALSIFPIIYVLTGGGPAGSTEPVNFYAYTMGFTYLEIPYAAAIIVIFFVFLLLPSYPLLRSIVRTRT